MLTSITNFLLSSIAKNEQFTKETQSVRRRYQIMCLIYMDILILLLLLAFCTAFAITIKDSRIFINIAIGPPIILASLLLIRIKKLNCAVLMLVLAFHLMNFISSEFLSFSAASFISLVIYPYFLLLVTSSMKVLIFNAVLCLFRFFTLSRRLYEIFDILDEEQHIQFSSLIVTLFFSICSVSIMSIFQKSMELMVWSSTEDNYQRSLIQAKEALQGVEAKNRFISMISHEIRNPLNAIKGSIDCLGQMITDESQLKILGSARMGGEILLNLVNNVLDAAKLRSDQIEIIYNETVFLDILKKVLIVNSDLMREKGLKVRVYLEENLPKTLFVDSSRLLQILMNLVSNAVKFTTRKGSIEIYVTFCSENESKETLLAPVKNRIPLGSETTLSMRTCGSPRDLDTTIEEMSMIETETFSQKISMISRFQPKSMTDIMIKDTSFSFNNNNNSCLPQREPWEIFGIRQNMNGFSDNQAQAQARARGYLKVQISDNGCGISDEDKTRLFGMFEQAVECSRRIQGGSGLGLWICKQLCQRMNGDIMAYSMFGKGSSFVFYLPLDRRNSFLQTPKALVVDGLSTTLSIHKLLLEQQRVKVLTACDGKEAFEKYKAQGKEPYSCVFMDADMPGMNGISAALKIREYEEKNKLRACEIYFVTEHHTEKELRSEYVKKGGNGQDVQCLRKPVGAEEMRLIVDGWKQF